MNTHYIKCWPEYFQAVKSGEKKAELRLNDRNYKQGDTLCIQEYDPASGYTNNRQRFDITHILHGPGFGLAAGFVMMSLAPALAATPAPAAAPATGGMGEAVGIWKHDVAIVPLSAQYWHSAAKKCSTMEARAACLVQAWDHLVSHLYALNDRTAPPATGAAAAAPAAGGAA